ncbi:MAG: DUF1697 domain-containing protein [Candidatus Bilamarchaeum sp.]|jgi:uncharacterized protein (DUF1697 family)
MTKYAALLRGINVGGNKIVKMSDLKSIFEKLGFENVKTLLASGNVVFETSSNDSEKIREMIKTGLNKELGMNIGVIVRSVDEIQKLIDKNPFKEIKITPETRLYVTFLSEKTQTKLKIPYQTEDGQFRILSANGSEVCSVLIVSKDKRSVDLMKIIEMEFGKNVTTRNWNTVVKIASSGL